MISDRGGQFLSLFWRALFQQARTKLHMTTAYHPQADGQSKQTNQSIEIALCHVVNGTQSDWVKYIDALETAHNNLTNTSTGKTPNEIVYGQNIRTTLDPHLLKAGVSVAAEDFV